jgi:DNA repair exonuclease SbcCD nuclease subunit
MAPRKKKTPAFRALVFSDPHFTMSPPAGRILGYGEAVLKKIHNLTKAAKKEKVNAVLIPGDFFHLKGEVTQREVQEMIRALREFDAPVVGIWGNHDARATSSIAYRAFGTLMESGVVWNCDQEMGTTYFDPGSDVSVVGRGFKDDYDTNEGASYRFEGDRSGPVVLLTHGMLVMKKDLVPCVDFVEQTRVQDIGQNEATAVINGHVHTCQGAEEHSGTLYVCPGGITRVTRSEKDRAVRACIIEVAEGKATLDKWIDVKVESAKAVFMAGDDSVVTVEDVRKVAATLRPDGGNIIDEAVQAVELAAASLSFGPEVINEAKRRLHDADE